MNSVGLCQFLRELDVTEKITKLISSKSELRQRIIIIFITKIIITKIYVAHMPDGKINRTIESETHKNVDLTNVKTKIRF